MEEKKKKKILKIIKYIGWACFLTAIILVGIGSCKKTNALEPINNYSIYTNMGQLTGVSNNNTLYTLDFTGTRIYYYYNGTNYEITNRYHNYVFYLDSNDLQNEVDETLKININELQIGTIVLFGGFVDNDNEAYYINRITTISRYLDKITDTAYSDGYTVGINATDLIGAYNEGKEKGLEEAQSNYLNSLNQNNDYWQEQYNSIVADRDYYRNLYNSGQHPWGSFTSLLGTIFLFPIKFFKEGFNIDFFGVNVGGFIIGLGLIGIILAIIGLILGRRRD